MTHPRTPLRLPWGPLLTVAGLTLIVFVLFRANPNLASPAPWPAFAAVALTAAMTFHVLRRLVSPFWGLMAGLVLAFHPYAWRWAPPFDQAMWAQALTAVILACVVESGRLAFLPRVALAGWAALLVLLTVAVGLCWLILPAAGVVGVLLTGLTLPVFAGLAVRQRRRPGLTELPSFWNICGALVVGLLAISAGTLLAPVAEPYVGEVIRTRLTPGMTPWETLGMPGWRLPGLMPDELRQWCWPYGMAVLPLMGWGVWCTLSRGWKQSARRQPPLAWVLTLYVAFALTGVALHGEEARDVALLPWAVLSVQLVAFCVGDTLRTMWESIRLAPPHEREE